MFGSQRAQPRTFIPVLILVIESFVMTTMQQTPYWAHVDLKTVPHISVPPPGPESKALHQRCAKHFKGLSTQVKLFPVAFESGHGCTLRDVDGNRYIDFSSGIYVTTLGHCHPKVTEA